MLTNDLFHLTWVYVETARNDHIFLSIDNFEEAVVRRRGQIAGKQPAVPHRYCRLFSVVKVALHDLSTFDSQLANFSRSHFPQACFEVNQSYIGIRQRKSDTPDSSRAV